MIRRLFCYIEYNKIKDLKVFKSDNYDLLEIGATLFADEEEVKTYHRFIYPQHFELMTKERYLSFGGLTKDNLQKAEKIEDIARRFCKTFYEYDLLIMWNREEYEILRKSLSRGGYSLPEHKPVFLMDLIKLSKGYVRDFRKELKSYQINTDNYNLTVSKYKARYMADLYFAARKIYSVFLKKEGYYLKKAKERNVIHNLSCSIGNRIPVQYIREANASDLFDGLECCNCCKGKMPLLPDKEHVRYPLKNQFTEEQIQEICDELNMKVSVIDGLVFVETSHSNWRIFHDYNKVTDVYHQNLRFGEEKHDVKYNDFNEGFHRQNMRKNKMYDVLYYIHTHDRDFLKGK